jgi:DNA-binding transcriptional MerR regulator
MHLGINTDGKKIYVPHALPGANNGGSVAANQALKRNHEERNEAILELRDAGWSNAAIHEILLDCGWHIEYAASINTIARLYQTKKQKRQEVAERRKNIIEQNAAKRAGKNDKKAEPETVTPKPTKPPRHPQVDELINIIEQWPAIAPTLLELVPIARDAEKWRIAQVFFSQKGPEQ